MAASRGASLKPSSQEGEARGLKVGSKQTWGKWEEGAAAESALGTIEERDSARCS